MLRFYVLGKSTTSFIARTGNLTNKPSLHFSDQLLVHTIGTQKTIHVLFSKKYIGFNLHSLPVSYPFFEYRIPKTLYRFKKKTLRNY